jgi:hypothetical protein
MYRMCTAGASMTAMDTRSRKSGRDANAANICVVPWEWPTNASRGQPPAGQRARAQRLLSATRDPALMCTGSVWGAVLADHSRSRAASFPA